MTIPNPPRIDADFDLTPYVDGLTDIIHTKISEILGYMDKLDIELALWMEAIRRLKKRGEIDDFSVWYWSFYAEINYSNYYICQKWLQYWLSLFEKTSDKKIVPIKEIKDKMEAAEEVQRAKQIPIENFYQGKLRGTGTRLMGLCPFHEESRPSFFIFTNTNTFNCFGCGANGDVIDFVQKTKDLTFSETINLLL